MDVSIRCPKLEKENELTIFPRTPSETPKQMRGEGALDRTISIAFQGKSYSIGLISVRIQKLENAPEVNAEQNVDELILFKQEVGCTFFFNHENLHDFTTAEMYVTLDAENFEALWKVLDENSTLQFKANLVGVNSSAEITLSDKGFKACTANLQIVLGNAREEYSNRVELRTTTELYSAMNREYFADDKHGQLANVAMQFAQSIALLNTHSKQRQDLCERANQLLQMARVTFHERLSISNDSYSNLFDLDIDSFEAALSDRDIDFINKKKTSYNHLWRHFTLKDILTYGEEKAGALANGYKNGVDDLETLARELLEDRRLKSIQLEWCLINALVYAEIIAFAQHVIPNKSLLGFSIQAPIKDQTHWKSAGKSLISSFGSLVWEGSKIFLTFVIASAITNENIVATWVVVSGITAARWLRKAVLHRELHPELNNAAVLTKMSYAHESMKRPDFNPKLTWELLNYATQNGAVFSPWIFHLLDDKINRKLIS